MGSTLTKKSAQTCLVWLFKLAFPDMGLRQGSPNRPMGYRDCISLVALTEHHLNAHIDLLFTFFGPVFGLVENIAAGRVIIVMSEQVSANSLSWPYMERD